LVRLAKAVCSVTKA